VPDVVKVKAERKYKFRSCDLKSRRRSWRTCLVSNSSWRTCLVSNSSWRTCLVSNSSSWNVLEHSRGKKKQFRGGLKCGKWRKKLCKLNWIGFRRSGCLTLMQPDISVMTLSLFCCFLFVYPRYLPLLPQMLHYLSVLYHTLLWFFCSPFPRMSWFLWIDNRTVS